MGDDHIGVDHLFLGLLRESERSRSKGRGAAVLDALGVDLKRARTFVEDTIDQGGGTSEEFIRFTRSARDVLALSLRESVLFGHDHIGTEHILLGVVREGSGATAR